MVLKEHRKGEDGRDELLVSVDAEAFAKAIDRAYSKTKNKINVPGFRKGKAPRNMIEKLYGEGFFYEDAINDLLPDAFDEALRKADIEIIGRPDVEIVSAGRKDGVELSFKVDLRPELTIKKYKGIAASKEVHNVEDADIDSEIKRLMEKASRLVEVEDRAAEKDDVAVIDFEGFVDGVAFEGGKGEKYNLTLGSGQFIPGFEDQIIGKKPGDEFDVNVTFPEDYGAEELAGKAATFKCKLHELRHKEYPELDDEFAKDVSEYNTLDELKASIREKLEKAGNDAAEAQFENDISDELIKNLEGDIPEVMIESRIDEMLRDFAYRMSSQGLDLETYMKITGQDNEALRKGLREQAERTVKIRLALEAVAKAEGYTFTDEDVEAEYKRMADEYKMDIERIRAMLTPQEVKSDLKATKALDFVKANAKATKPRKKAEPKAEDGKAAKAPASRAKKASTKAKATEEETEKPADDKAAEGSQE